MINNKNFYPTPTTLANTIFNKYVKELKDVTTILEPSCGKGDFINSFINYIPPKAKNIFKFQDRINSDSEYWKNQEIQRKKNRLNIQCIESDTLLSDILKQNKFNVIWDDFLTFQPINMYDLILMNPPFDNGSHHLLKAIEIQERIGGKIICLLNAETLNNPHSNNRKVLLDKLEHYNADIEFISNAFSDAERKTDVEIAIIYLNITMKQSDTEFSRDFEANSNMTINECINDIVPTMSTLDKLLLEYNIVIQNGTNIYKEKIRMDKLFGRCNIHNDLIELKYSNINEFIEQTNMHFWQRFINETDLESRLPSNLKDNFRQMLSKERYSIVFNKRNVELFYMDLIEMIPQAYETTCGDIFDKITRDYAYSESQWNKNIHLFNGWKTNSVYKVGKKAIIEVWTLSAFNNAYGSVIYSIPTVLEDLNIIFENLSGEKDLDFHVSNKENKRNEMVSSLCKLEVVETKFFKIKPYKKGTLHIEFKDMDLLEKFNIIACKGKNWIPSDFAEKPFSSMTDDEKELVKSFGLNPKSYDKLLSQKSGYLRLT